MGQSGAGFDPDDRRPDALGNGDDGIGIGVEQTCVVSGDGLGGLRRHPVVKGITDKIQHGKIPSDLKW
jgi:hypothetical protein